MDLDGSNKKLIVKDEKLRYADFYFVYNDEAYYYSTFYQENRKVNLNSGAITSLNNNDIYNQNTLNKNFVYSFVSTPYSLYNNNHFKKVDLLNNKVIDDVKIDWQSTLSNYYLDYNNVDVYYYNGFTENSGIYKNNDYLYKFNEENNADLVFLGVEKNYLYYFYNSKIYKLNIDTQNIEGEFNFNVKKIYRLDSMIGCNYFYFNNKIHEFDFINNTFKLVVDNIEKLPNFVYKINNKLIFTENVYNLNYYVPEHVSKNILGSITVYDLNNKTTNKYDSVTKFSYYDNFLYIMLEKNDEYFVEKISVN